MLPHIVAIISVLALAVLLALLIFTTPVSAGPFGLLLVLVAAYIFSIGVISLVLYWGSRLTTYMVSGFVVKKPLKPIQYRRAYYYSTMLAMAPVMIVGLQSVGALGVYEVLLVFLFEIISCIYISRVIA